MSKLQDCAATYQPYEHPIEPAQDVWSIVSLRPEDSDPGHEDSRCLLVIAGRYVLHVDGRVHPTVAQHSGHGQHSDTNTSQVVV